ncbi:transglycosylase domain-containing protein [Streptomyces sp. SP18CS02]|uniref:transglycosylase domain-containing protein n=1 Tax=Streptomyces sp. SP18CS02 TaxID=3002531 RepID=UPI002E75F51A|nr:transglycosylase domain-containing protein [Streptomyces sp. SP18CS02]MEE1752314.1 transglycosylase domain-containing protein [Streptomyces sp. SP18CS02]
MSDDPPQPGWYPRDPTVAVPAGPVATGTPRGDGRSARGRRPPRTGLRRLVPTWRTVLGTFLFLALLVIGGFFAGYHLVAIPAANAAATAQSNVYLYKDGSQIARDGEINRENVRLEQVPVTVQHAVLAAEDRDFYTESAVDPEAMLRAAWNTVTGKGTQGGSTITQQYVKNYYLGQERTITRKVKEFFIAIKLDREKTKDEIFEGYLNTSYYGRNAYGIQAAARAYYGHDVQHVGTGQAAYLASLLNAPSAYDIGAHPQNRPSVEARWNYVLDAMVKERWLVAGERASLPFPVPQTARPSTGLAGQRGYIVQAVEDYLTDHRIIDATTLATGGYRITTTLERAKQDAFAQAVADQVTSRLSEGNAADHLVRVGGAAIDPATGKVVAMYGGIDFTKQYVNNATRRDYQVGSTFKPFVFASAVDNGSTTQNGERITPNTVYDGTNKRPVRGWSGAPYAPANEDDVSYGPITVRTATDKSVNAVYAQLAVDVGPGKVEQTAVRLGLPADTPDLTASPSIALGPATASVLDMAEAYATLANHGRHGTYTLVEKVQKDGTDLALPVSAGTQVISREAADTTTAVLRGVVEGGTGTAARSAGPAAAGKTGTAEDDKAAWFAGYTPELATVVAVMGQDPKTGAQKPLYGALGLPRINGGGAPAQIWGQFTRAALQGTPPREFDLRLAEGAELEQEPLPADPLRPHESASGEYPDDRAQGGAADGGGNGTGGTGGPGGTDGDPGGTRGPDGRATAAGATAGHGRPADSGFTAGATTGGVMDGQVIGGIDGGDPSGMDGATGGGPLHFRRPFVPPPPGA